MSSEPGRPYRGRSPEERTEERRARLLVAGRACFESDAAELSVSQVSAAAGVSKRHFYELFEDRLAFVLALHDEAMTWFREGLADEADPDDPVGWLTRVVPALFARLLEDPARAQVLARAPVLFPSISPNVAGLVVDGLVRRVVKAPGRPQASRERVRRHAMGAVFAGRAVLVEWLLADGGPRRGRVMNGYVADVLSVSTAALAPVLSSGRGAAGPGTYPVVLR